MAWSDPTEAQIRARKFLFEESPLLGYILLYSLAFFVTSVFLDVWECFDPGRSQLNNAIYRYSHPIFATLPLFLGRRFLWKKRMRQGSPEPLD